MLYNNIGKGTILLTPGVLATFSKYQQTGSKTEAGGYLMGREFGGQLVVEVATEPGADDVRKRFFFKRNKYRGQKLVDKIWKASGRITVSRSLSVTATTSRSKSVRPAGKAPAPPKTGTEAEY